VSSKEIGRAMRMDDSLYKGCADRSRS